MREITPPAAKQPPKKRNTKTKAQREESAEPVTTGKRKAATMSPPEAPVTAELPDENLSEFERSRLVCTVAMPSDVVLPTSNCAVCNVKLQSDFDSSYRCVQRRSY